MFWSNIEINYFKEINTKEKAYWLGFIYADGYITKDRDILRFGIEISKKDEILIDRICQAVGFNSDYKANIKQKS